MRGRKPKPTHMKLVEGNPGKRKINRREPKPPEARVECPPELKGDARKEWDRIAPVLKAMGLLTEVDRAALMAYCRSYSNWLSYEKLSDRAGAELAIAKGYRKAALLERQQMRNFATEFGFTPSSRSRIHAPEAPGLGEKKEEDDLEAILGDRGKKRA